MKRIVIAIGGNAIMNPKDGSSQQLEKTGDVCLNIASLIKKGYDLILTHGNGPQVGNILALQEACGRIPPQPLDVCGAQTQGQIGYMIQQCVGNALKQMGSDKKTATVVTQVVVDRDDPAFASPTKPVGLFYGHEKEEEFLKKGYAYIKEKRGVRRVVPSPEPNRIVEIDTIRSLVEQGAIVIAAGGGGIPVVEEPETGLISGVEAVIDKDLTAALMAGELGAGGLIILTDVDKVALDFGKENQEDLDRMTVREAREYMRQGHFGKGSMEPKIEAAVRFIESGGKIVKIMNLKDVGNAFESRVGTEIIN